MSTERPEGGLDSKTKEEAATELTAVEAGYGPLNQDLVEELGRFSLARFEMENMKEEIDRNQDNLLFLNEVAKLLPKIIMNWDYEEAWAGQVWGHPRFELSGQQAVFLYRQLQANTLWSRNDSLYLPTPGRPYYVIGRTGPKKWVKTEENKNNEHTRFAFVSLLLLPAAIEKYETRDLELEVNAPVAIDVLKDDLDLWDELRQNVEGRDLTEEEMQVVLDKTTARLILRGNDKYSMDKKFGGVNINTRWGGLWNGGKPEKRFKRNGVRYFYPVETFENGVPTELLAKFQINTHIAKLASAFRITGQLHTLLAGQHETSAPSIEQVLNQNHELKDALKTSLRASGSLTDEEIDNIIEKRFPTLG